MFSRLMLLILSVVAVLGPARAEDLYDLYHNSHSKQPFVAFMARKSGQTISKPGHAFVAVGTELDNGILFYEAIMGYYPKDETVAGEVKAIYATPEGTLTFAFKDLAWDVEYRVNVSQVSKAAALNVAQRWKSSDPKYNLFNSGGKNCSAFAAEVAAAIGLKAPSDPGSKLPIDYIRELKSLNGGGGA